MSFFGMFDHHRSRSDQEEEQVMNSLNAEIEQHNAELASRAKEISQQKLDIIKSQGMPDYTAHRPNPSPFGNIFGAQK